MSIVADSYLVLLLDIGEEGTLVVDTEGEDTVLVGDGELGAVDGAVFRLGGRLEVEAMEGGQHGELELKGVILGDLERHILVIAVLGDFNAEDL